MSNPAAEAFHPIAALPGVEMRHTDALGVVHEPDAEALQALIAAFGLPADPAKAAAMLTEMQHAAPLGLDPLYIAAAEAPALDLPLADGPVEWHLDIEHGGQAEGIW